MVGKIEEVTGGSGMELMWQCGQGDVHAVSFSQKLGVIDIIHLQTITGRIK